MFLSYILQKLKKCKFHYLCEIGVYFVKDVINGPSQNFKGLIERLGYTPEQKWLSVMERCSMKLNLVKLYIHIWKMYKSDRLYNVLLGFYR